MWEPMRILPELTNRQGPELALGEPEYRSALIPPEMQDSDWQLIGALRNKPQEARRADAPGAFRPAGIAPSRINPAEARHVAKTSSYAAEARVGGHEWCLQPGQAATLGNGPARKQGVKMLYSTFRVEVLVQGIVQFAQVDDRAAFVKGIVLLQRSNGLPVIFCKVMSFLTCDFHCDVLRPVQRSMWEIGVGHRLLHELVDVG